MAQEDDAKRVEEAKRLSKDQPAQAEKIYQEILSKPPPTTDKAIRDYENALTGLGELYRDHNRPNDLAALIQQTRDVLTSFTRAKTSKLSMALSSQGVNRFADMWQSDNSLTSSRRYPIHSKPRSASQSHVSTGLYSNGKASSVKIWKSDS